MVNSLRRRLALWTTAATLLGLIAFAVVAYVIVTVEETDEAASGVPDDPADVASEAREQMLIALAIAAPIGVALAFAAATWASRRAMASIDEAARTAAEISIDRFDRRMALPEPGHELRPLAEAINALLDRLQRGYDALAAFSADASHELRTPLAAVCSELEVGLRRPRDAATWETSAQVGLAELRRLATVVDAMLRFAQANTARASEIGEVGVADVIGEVSAANAEAAARGGVALVAELGDATPAVRGDADLIATALGNLVGNAVRLSPRDREVAISVAAAVDGVAIHVDDRGPGLPADRDALFVPFARSGPQPGVGLGLAIARRIARHHGGDVTCEPRDGGGARFSLRLPRV